MSASTCSIESSSRIGAQAHLTRGAGVLADVDGELADPLDEGEDLLTRLLGDDLTKQ